MTDTGAILFALAYISLGIFIGIGATSIWLAWNLSGGPVEKEEHLINGQSLSDWCRYTNFNSEPSREVRDLPIDNGDHFS